MYMITSLCSLICQSDVGGQRTLQRRWTTFAKAQLLCQADHELPYNVLQDIDTLLPAEGAPVDDILFYGIFTSQWLVMMSPEKNHHVSINTNLLSRLRSTVFRSLTYCVGEACVDLIFGAFRKLQ